MFASNKYILMNKDNPVVEMDCIRDSYNIPVFVETKFYTDLLLPIGYSDADSWIRNRRAPKHRKHIKELLIKCGCDDLEGFVRFTFCAGLNDTFWIKPVDADVDWGRISLFRNEFDENIARLAFDGGLYGEQFSSATPELVTDGSFAKCWKRFGDRIYLLKQGSEGVANAGREPYSEKYVYELSKLICSNPVEYDLIKIHGKVASRCELFCSESVGYAPIVNLLSANANFKSCLSFFEELGNGEEFKEMIVLDALTFNTDRHLKNFGVLFDTETLKIQRMAPIFDNNLALLPYSMSDDLNNLDKYLPTRDNAFGGGFNELALQCITPQIKNKLINLQGFRFSRDNKYGFDEERLLALEKVVNLQIDNLLHQRIISVNIEQNPVVFESAVLTFNLDNLTSVRDMLEDENFTISDFVVKTEEGLSVRLSDCKSSTFVYGDVLEVEIYSAKLSNVNIADLNIMEVEGLMFNFNNSVNNVVLLPQKIEFQLAKGTDIVISEVNQEQIDCNIQNKTKKNEDIKR